MTTVGKPPKEWTPLGYSGRVDALQLLPHRVRVLLAAGWARSVLPAWEEKYPRDDRPRKAIEAAERWVFGAPPAAANAAAAATNAANAAAYAANAAAAAAYAGNKWSWLYRTYCHARGPDGLVFEPVWKTGAAVGMAKEIVATRAFDLMPILADALQDAGCDHADLLDHLRGDADEKTLADWTLTHLLGLWDGEVAA